MPQDSYDYVKREVMIPMRDGVKLFTSIVVPKGAKNAPILLTRTPYNASGRTERNHSSRMIATLPQGDEVFVADGYIRVFQDVRGKYKSEGDYWMTPPGARTAEPNRYRSRDRYLRHHRLVGEEHAGIERPRGHDRFFV